MHRGNLQFIFPDEFLLLHLLNHFLEVFDEVDQDELKFGIIFSFIGTGQSMVGMIGNIGIADGRQFIQD